MKIRFDMGSAGIAICLFLLAAPGWLGAQSTGSVEFTAQVAPADGRPEPVRQMTFYLLRKDLEDIRQEAQELEPPPDLDKFVDSLTASPKLKEWMKKNHTVQLRGANLAKSLSPDEVVDIPEFYNAYMLRNSGYEGTGFPKPKFKLKDEISNPQKFIEVKAEYKEAVRKYIATAPESVQGIETELIPVDPSVRWGQITDEQQRQLERHTLDLAQNRYLAAQTDTNLDGRGRFTGLAPGKYWINMLGVQAISGDVRLRWDFPVAVRAGELTHVELSNQNAVKPYTAAQNSND
jgi:hypothetical protein